MRGCCSNVRSPYLERRAFKERFNYTCISVPRGLFVISLFRLGIVEIKGKGTSTSPSVKSTPVNLTFRSVLECIVRFRLLITTHSLSAPIYLPALYQGGLPPSHTRSGVTFWVVDDWSRAKVHPGWVPMAGE